MSPHKSVHDWQLCLILASIVALGCGVPVRAATMGLVPVRASGVECPSPNSPPGVGTCEWYLEDGELNLWFDDQDIRVESFVEDWDPEGTGIGLYIAHSGFDCATYNSDAVGALEPILVDCAGVFDEASFCAGSNENRPDFLFLGILILPLCDFMSPCLVPPLSAEAMSCGALVIVGSGSVDDGQRKYLAEMGLRVPVGAAGTFNLAITLDPNRSFIYDSLGNQLPIQQSPMATIRVRTGSCCVDSAPGGCRDTNETISTCSADGGEFLPDGVCAGPTVPPLSFSVAPWNNSCMNDGECTNESVCVPLSGGILPGRCYVTKNRILSMRPNPGNGCETSARRVSVMSGGSPVVLGWMDAPIAAFGLGGLLVSRLSSVPVFHPWGSEGGEVHFTGCVVQPGRTYLIETTTDGVLFTEPLELKTTNTWGDVVGQVVSGVTSPPQGVANLVDAQQAVKGFQSTATEPKTWHELHPADANAVINVVDAQQAVKGFQGKTFFDMPGAPQSPCDCPELGDPPCLP